MNTPIFLVGYVGTWFILSFLADMHQMGELAAALAIAIAVTATFTFGPAAAANIFNTGKGATP